MPEREKNGRCAHPQCTCPAARGERYCSETCRNTVNDPRCLCGHPDCGG